LKKLGDPYENRTRVFAVVISSEVAGCPGVPSATNICFVARHLPSSGFSASWNSSGNPRRTKGGRAGEAAVGASVSCAAEGDAKARHEIAKTAAIEPSRRFPTKISLFVANAVLAFSQHPVAIHRHPAELREKFPGVIAAGRRVA